MKENKEGNYWNDWQKSKPYSIDGNAESVDRYPLNTSFERLSIGFLCFLISLIFMSIALVLKRKLGGEART